MAEAFRSGLESVNKVQYESGLSIGLSRGQVVQYVVFSQALSVSAPALIANVIFLINQTSVFSAVALMLKNFLKTKVCSIDVIKF